MVRALYYKEVDGITMSPTIVGPKSQHKYKWFTLYDDYDKGTCILKLESRDSVHHTAYFSTLENEPWFHK